MINKFLAATRRNNALYTCDLLGNTQPLCDVVHVLPDATFFTYRPSPNDCTVYDLHILDNVTFDKLCANLKQHVHSESTLFIYAISVFTVTIEHNGYRSDVFYGGDKRWKCISSRCKSHNHYRCEHARFVQAVVPVEAVEYVSNPDEDYSDLIQTY